MVICSSDAFAADKKQKAKLGISGYGLVGNLELKRTLKSLDLKWKERENFDANFIEDSALIIISRLKSDGYLNPQITAELTFPDDAKRSFTWRQTIDPPMPRPLLAKEVRFKIEKGILYHYEELQFNNLTELTEKEAAGYFVERGALIPFKGTRIFTPEKMRRGIANVTEVFTRRGYEDAEVTVSEMKQNDETGEVDVTLNINTGKKSLVRSIRQETFVSTNRLPIEVETIETNTPLSKIWEQDLAAALKATNYHRGYPDTTVDITPLRRKVHDEEIDVDMLATVKTGEQIFLRGVQFEGLNKARRSVLDRRVDLEEGEVLNRVEAEKGRSRLAKLGIFDTIALRYETVDEHTRNVIYSVKEGKRLNVHLLFGYGSYELARAGFELEQKNVFGRGHRARLRAMQSLKSTTADYLYTMPEFIGENVDMLLNAFYLRREEIDFTREEYGGGAGAKVFIDEIQSEFGARYNYQVLSALDAEFIEGPTNAGVGALLFDLKHDRRDSPLYPRRGYKTITTFEMASQYLAGDVDFWRFENQNSYHRPLDEGRWLHFGLSHGFVYTLRGPEKDLPFNKRFFPGGDTSVRGFQFGEASPRTEQGKIAGAETYTVGNLEFEQALTEKWSLVAFVDAIGFARRIADYPFNSYRVSVGGGIRWKTMIGPVRLEYGHNVMREEADPSGTLHFAIGFPF